MIQDIQNRKKALLRPIVCVLIGVLGIYLLLILTPRAEASNVYFDNVSIFTDSEGFTKFRFRVLTSWTNEYRNNDPNCNSRSYNDVRFDGKWGSIFTNPTPDWGVAPFFAFAPDSAFTSDANCIGFYTWTAGNTYETYLITGANAFPWNKNLTEMKAGAYFDKTAWTTTNYFMTTGGAYYPNHAQFPIYDSEKYYFTEFPSLTITYPEDEMEIAEAFYITGSYTLPEGSSLDKLMAYFGYDVSGEANFYEFYQDVSPPSGSVNIRVAGLPSRSYKLGFSFINTSDEDDYYMVLKWYDIHIIKSIPPELPDGETPPIVFDILDPASYYTANSSYASSTLLFDNISGALKPIILTIGNNLTFFSSKFEQSKAQETGETMAGGVLVVRTYANNLNTFFSDLPIAQALFLYLLLLVVVAVFRIIKNLINLIKP